MSKQDWIPEEGVDYKNVSYKKIDLGRAKDITGQVFGRYTTLFRVKKGNVKEGTYWLFQCSCGNLSVLSTGNIMSGNNIKCKDCSIEERRDDISGKIFGRLLVLKYLEKGKYLCRCECGTEKPIDKQSLIKGTTVSCGCKRIHLLQLEGQQFGKLKVIGFAYIKNKNSYWKCQCECGKEIIVLGASLTSGNTQSCGCLKKGSRIKDLTGFSFGRLKVLALEKIEDERAFWKCQCQCGEIVTVNSHYLVSGDTKSCGCLKSSYGEELIADILKENNIPFSTQYWFTDCRDKAPFPFDFAIFNENNNLSRLIEYDGEQHFKPIPHWGGEEGLKERQQHDQIKNDYCKAHNIPLVRIPYTELKNLSIKMLLGDEFLVS